MKINYFTFKFKRRMRNMKCKMKKVLKEWRWMIAGIIHDLHL